MAEVLKLSREDSEIISAIKSSENERLKSIAKKIVSVQRYAKGVEKDAESQKDLNRMFQDLCRMAALSLTEIEDALFEWTHPGQVASECELCMIEEIGEKKLVRDLAQHIVVGSKIGSQYMENVGARGLPPIIKHDRGIPIRKELKKNNSKNGKDEQKGYDSKKAKSVFELLCFSNENIDILRDERFLLSSIPEFRALLHPWGLVPPDTTAIPRFTMERERKQSSSPLPVMDICLSRDPVLFLQRWEAREAALNRSVFSPRTSTHHLRKRRRSPSCKSHTPDNDTINSQGNTSHFFPSLSRNTFCVEVPPSLMRCVVHCGVSHLDLPL